MNKKGFTLIEVTVSIVIVSLILVTLLGSLVRLREIYTSSEENSEVVIYASSVSRIINKDVINNNGIRDIVCNELKNECELILSNEEKRRIEILTINDEEDEGKIKHEEIRTTLRYTDITENEKLLYMKTLKLDRYTNTETKEITTKGYNFLNIESKKNEYEGENENKDIITEIKIEIYNGEDRNDKRYDIGIYGTTRYDYKNIIGKTYKIEFDDKDADVIGTRGIEEEYGVGYYKYESAHRKEDRIEKIEIPTKEGKVFGGYYYKDGVHEDILVVDIEGNIVTNNRLFTSDINKKDEYPKVEAVWEDCSGGYEIVDKKCKPKEFTITLNKENGTGGEDSLKVKYKTKLDNIEVPTRQDYIFDGYYTQRNGEGTKYYDKDGVAQVVTYEETTDITLYAKWIEIFLAGTGTPEDPYKIQCIEDLVELSNNVNKKGNSYTGKYFELTRNLDFKTTSSYRNSERTDYGDINGINNTESLIKELTTGSGFEPIGGGSNYFKGNFDGNNNRIDNLYIKNSDATKISIGLFGYIENSTISNLTLSGNIETTESANIGGIAGDINNSTIKNCHNYVNITSKVGSYSIGGIVGGSHGTSSITDSTNNSLVSGSNNTGGIVGYSNSKLTIERSTNNGNITNDLGQNIGGILGRDNAETNETNIINSNNKGQINSTRENSTTYTGGLVGRIYGTLNVQNSNNEGKITINSNSTFSVGGLIGSVDGKANINNSHNKNSITSNKVISNVGRDIGGLVGLLSSTQTSIITNSSNETAGVISGGNRTGGIVGECMAGVILNNSYNLANISSGDIWSSNIFIGGLLGTASSWGIKHEDIIILNSYNKGNLSVNIDNYSAIISGLIGQQIGSASTNTTDISSNTKIINSYDQGSITMNGNTTGALIASGIMQIGPKNITINNVYNIGVLNSIKDNYVIANNNSSVNTNYKNVYYLNTLTGTKPTDTTNVIGKTADEMKSQSFVTLLNSNKNSVNLTDIDSRLTGYTLCDWKLGTSGYPELDCK